MKALIKTSIALVLSLGLLGSVPARADGFKNCTKAPKAS